jgi:ABC-type hemin transport system substrate-binding protein
LTKDVLPDEPVSWILAPGARSIYMFGTSISAAGIIKTIGCTGKNSGIPEIRVINSESSWK